MVEASDCCLPVVLVAEAVVRTVVQVAWLVLAMKQEEGGNSSGRAGEEGAYDGIGLGQGEGVAYDGTGRVQGVGVAVPNQSERERERERMVTK